MRSLFADLFEEGHADACENADERASPVDAPSQLVSSVFIFWFANLFWIMRLVLLTFPITLLSFYVVDYFDIYIVTCYICMYIGCKILKPVFAAQLILQERNSDIRSRSRARVNRDFNRRNKNGLQLRRRRRIRGAANFRDKVLANMDGIVVFKGAYNAEPQIMHDRPRDRKAYAIISKRLDAGEMASLRSVARYNPTGERKAKHLRKYAIPLVQEVGNYALNLFKDTATDFFEELGFCRDIESQQRLCEEIKKGVHVVSHLKPPQAAATGHGFPFGTKKRDVSPEVADSTCRDFVETVIKARGELKDKGVDPNSDEGFEYVRKTAPNIFRSTGRAKFGEPDVGGTARLVTYMGYAPFMLAYKYANVFNSFFKRRKFDVPSAIGYSQTGGGVRALYDYFAKCIGCCVSTLAKACGWVFYSIDVSGWDASVHRYYLDVMREHHVKEARAALMTDDSLSDRDVDDYLYVLDYIIYTTIVSDIAIGSDLYRVFRGIKSGTPTTATDNTIIHIIVFRCICKAFFLPFDCVHSLFYGDDNIGCVDRSYANEYDESFFVGAYATFGFKVKPTNRAFFHDTLSGPDFLSKHHCYNPDDEVPFFSHRPTLDNVARACMPDEYLPKASAERTMMRLLGQYFDGYWNRRTREIFYQAMVDLSEELEPGIIDIRKEYCTERQQYMLAAIGWGRFRLKEIPNKIKNIYAAEVIPSAFDIETVNETSTERWPLKPPDSDVSIRDADEITFDDSNGSSDTESDDYNVSASYANHSTPELRIMRGTVEDSGLALKSCDFGNSVVDIMQYDTHSYQNMLCRIGYRSERQIAAETSRVTFGSLNASKDFKGIDDHLASEDAHGILRVTKTKVPASLGLKRSEVNWNNAPKIIPRLSSIKEGNEDRMYAILAELKLMANADLRRNAIPNSVDVMMKRLTAERGTFNRFSGSAGYKTAECIMVAHELGALDGLPHNLSATSIGGHPGSEVLALFALFPSIKLSLISKIPTGDTPFSKCRKYLNECVKVVTDEFRESYLTVKQHLIFMDLYPVDEPGFGGKTKKFGSRSSNIHFQIIKAIVDYIRLNDLTDVLIFKLAGFEEDIVRWLYMLKQHSCCFDLVKPADSYNTNFEYYVVLRFHHEGKMRDIGPLCEFQALIYAYSNNLARTVMFHDEIRMKFLVGYKPVPNPKQEHSNELSVSKFLNALPQKFLIQFHSNVPSAREYVYKPKFTDIANYRSISDFVDCVCIKYFGGDSFLVSMLAKHHVVYVGASPPDSIRQEARSNANIVLDDGHCVANQFVDNENDVTTSSRNTFRFYSRGPNLRSAIVNRFNDDVSMRAIGPVECYTRVTYYARDLLQVEGLAVDDSKLLLKPSPPFTAGKLFFDLPDDSALFYAYDVWPSSTINGKLIAGSRHYVPVYSIVTLPESYIGPAIVILRNVIHHMTPNDIERLFVKLQHLPFGSYVYIHDRCFSGDTSYVYAQHAYYSSLADATRGWDFIPYDKPFTFPGFKVVRDTQLGHGVYFNLLKRIP